MSIGDGHARKTIACDDEMSETPSREIEEGSGVQSTNKMALLVSLFRETTRMKKGKKDESAGDQTNWIILVEMAIVLYMTE